MPLRGLDIDLDLLPTFWHVAHATTITEALPNLPYGLTRSAVSRRIATLEEQLGFPVFEESQRVRLTEAGGRLLRTLEKQLPELAEVVFQLRDQHAPKLSVGGSAAFAQGHWPFLLKRLLAFEPRVDARVVSDTEENLLAALEKGRLQLIVIPLDHPMPRHFLRRRLIALPLVLLVPKDCPIETAEQLKTEKQIPYRAALPETSPTLIAEMKKHLRRLGLRIRSTQSCSLIDVLYFVASGGGIGLSLLEPTLVTHPGVRVIPLKKWPPIEIGIVWRSPGSPLEKRVVSLVAERARELWGEGEAKEQVTRNKQDK